MFCLRFGIISVDFNKIIEGARKHGINYKFQILDHIKPAIESGFKHIELNLDVIYSSPHCLSDKVKDELLDLKEQKNITFTAHLPICAIELSWLNENIRKASVTSIVESIKIIEFLDPEYYVIHATGDHASNFYRLLKKYKDSEVLILPLVEKASQSIEEILAKTEINPRKIACETVEFPLKYTIMIAENYDLSFLVDTGHVLSGQPGTTDLLKVTRTVRNRLVGFHIHDGYLRIVNGEEKRADHLPLGYGDMPLKEFFQLLKEIDFKGPLVFELPLSEALKSMKYIKETLPEHNIA